MGDPLDLEARLGRKVPHGAIREEADVVALDVEVAVEPRRRQHEVLRETVVRGAQRQVAARPQHAARPHEQPPWTQQVLDHLESDDGVERLLLDRPGQLLDRMAQKRRAGMALASCRDRPLGDVEPDRLEPVRGERANEIARARPGVQDAASAGRAKQLAKQHEPARRQRVGERRRLVACPVLLVVLARVGHSTDNLYRVSLRIVVHDYSGHPFQVQLSRELAGRGHDVLHLHCPSYRSGKGALERAPRDPQTLEIEPVALDGSFDKYSPVRRFRQEREYGRRLAARVRQARPDVLLSSNTPLFAQQTLLSVCRRVPFVFWQQDIYSVAMKREAERRLPLIGRRVGDSFVAIERRMLDRSGAVVTIAEDFRSEILRWGVPAGKVHVIENWAPLEELPERPRDNEWSRAHGLADKRVFLYSGTLGLKHDPELLVQLARGFRDETDVRVVVCSEGTTADSLAAEGPENLIVLCFQPYEQLPDVLAAGEVLLAILEAGAGSFAVPSKVLSYHCAGRAILAAVPAQNLAGRIVSENETGIVVDPDDRAAFLAAARRLLGDSELRERMGRQARAYAERTFDIVTIGDRFEQVLESVAEGAQVPSAP